VIPDLVEKGRVSRGFLGITFQDVDRTTADALDLPSDQGVLVRTVQPGTPADEAGIETGDVITDFDGQPVVDGQRFRMMVAQAGPGKKVAIGMVRSGKKINKRLILADRDKLLSGIQEEPAPQEEDEDWLGLKVSTSTEGLAAQYNVEYHPGVLVLEVEPGSPAEQGGFRAGDIVTKVDDQKIEDSDQFRNTARRLKDEKKALLFLVYRGGEPFFIAVKPE
jgi:serine protease Do